MEDGAVPERFSSPRESILRSSSSCPLTRIFLGPFRPKFTHVNVPWLLRETGVQISAGPPKHSGAPRLSVLLGPNWFSIFEIRGGKLVPSWQRR